MADENVITSFLVALGYDVNANEERRFVDSIGKAKVAALALVGTLTALVATIEKVASSYEQLYYASQRMGASVANIQAFSYAMSQVGGTTAGAAAALESLGSFLRSGPGAESFMQRLGIQTRDANGGLRDTTAQLEDFFRVAKTMPYYRAQAYASVLGIDDRTLQAGMRGLGEFSAQLKGMYRAAGIDSQAAAAGSAKFMQQLRAFGAALQVLRDKVGISLEHGVGGMIDRLRRLLVANFGRISEAIVTSSKFIIGLGWALMLFVGGAANIVGRLIDWFNSLDSGTRMWTAGLLLLAAALATPEGLILALGLAIVGLTNDYEGWKDGKNSLIDWKQWEPGITYALQSIKEIGDSLRDIWPKVRPNLEKLASFLGHDLLVQLDSSLHEISLLMQALDAAMNHHYGKAAGLLWEASQAAMDTFQPGSGQVVGAVGDAVGGVVGDIAENAYALKNSRGLRNNNPLNLSYLPGQGSLGSDGRFGRYASMADGIAATTRQLLSYRKKGIDTVSAIIRKWAPESENGSDDSYIAQVAKWSGLDPNAHIDVRDANVAQRLISAMGRHESGLMGRDEDVRSGVYAGLGGTGLDDRITRSIGADNRRYGAADPALKGFGGGGPNVHAPMTTTINVNGAGNPEQVAQSVARKQDWVAASLVRNMGPLAQ